MFDLVGLFGRLFGGDASAAQPETHNGNGKYEEHAKNGGTQSGRIDDLMRRMALAQARGSAHAECGKRVARQLVQETVQKGTRFQLDRSKYQESTRVLSDKERIASLRAESDSGADEAPAPA